MMGLHPFKKKDDGITRASTVSSNFPRPHPHPHPHQWGKRALKDHLVRSYELKKKHSKKQDETMQCTKNHWQLCLINNRLSSSESDDFTFSCTF